MGLLAENEVTSSRTAIANALSVSKNEIYFTSGGTEANNISIFGAVNARKRLGNKIVTTTIEHSSVYETIKHLESIGFEVVYLTPDENGEITINQLSNAIDSNTILVSMMYINNETGLILPIDKIAKVIKAKNAPAIFHCDAVQAFGKINIKPKKLEIDLLSISSHKIYGPQGVGALYIKNGVRILPHTFGGEQESRIRPGTQATALIAGFGQAVKEIDYTSFDKIQALNNYLKEQIKTLDNVIINSQDNNFPYILNFSVVGIKSETLLHFLASKNIYVSSGSACAKGKSSHVLNALNIDKKYIDSAIRVSFCKDNSFSDIDLLINSIDEATKTLVRKI